MDSGLAFSCVRDDEALALAEWLAAETWSFHPRARWTREDALASIRAGDFTGSNPTYWVELAGAGRIGIVLSLPRGREPRCGLSPRRAVSRPGAREADG